MSRPVVVSVTADSAADHSGIVVGDVLVSINGVEPRDVIGYRLLVDEPELVIEYERGGMSLTVEVEKEAGEAFGLEVDSAVFDGVTTCDNHCSFCFIYQLPRGMRKSLYLKDDDYRLSFLYGNFTTLTRFTEADLERVVSEGLSPLYVSIHATDPDLRAKMLRNRRGAVSLRWLRALLDHGVQVHGQIVVCPGVNDAEALEDTLVGVLSRYPELETLAVVPLGVSSHSNEESMRPHSVDEAVGVVDLVEQWQQIYLEVLGRRMVYAADEYYLLADRPFPAAETYDGFAMYEDGIGMARSFELEFTGVSDDVVGPAAGFFAWVDGAPAEGYRAPRCEPDPSSQPSNESPVQLLSTRRPGQSRPTTIITGSYGAQVLRPLLANSREFNTTKVLAVPNRFFGGNIAVTGLLTGADVSQVLQDQPENTRYLLPDVCLSGGRFLDGVDVKDLSRPVEVIATNGHALRQALQQ